MTELCMMLGANIAPRYISDPLLGIEMCVDLHDAIQRRLETPMLMADKPREMQYPQQKTLKTKLHAGKMQEHARGLKNTPV